jgi:hypothetical protein
MSEGLIPESRLADKLAERIFAWRPAPDRYLKPEGGWVARSRFRPFDDVRDALRLAGKLTRRYSLRSTPDGFTVEVNHGGRVGRATDKSQARAITLAVADAIGVDPITSANDVRRKGRPKAS